MFKFSELISRISFSNYTVVSAIEFKDINEFDVDILMNALGYRR